MVQLADATLNDIDALLAIETTFGKDAWNYDQFYSELTNPYGYYRVAKDHQVIVGYCGALILMDQADIQTIAITPLYRRQGIATLLLNDVLSHLASKAVQDVFLEVAVSNTDAIRLYERFGFKNIGIRRAYYQSGDDAIIMKKELSNDHIGH